MTLAPLRVARGMAAPASATAPPLARRGAACAGGWPFLAPPSSRHTSWSGSTAGLRVDSLPDTLRGRDALASACGEKIGGVLRGGFSRALLAACGGSALRASGGGARWDAVRGTPPRTNPASDPRSSRLASRSGLTYARRTKPPRTADFQRRLSVRAFQGHFLVKIGRFWAYGGPRDPILPKKRPSKALQGRLQLAPSVPLRGKLGATCFSAA